MEVTFRYQKTLALTAGAGGYATEEYSMNSPYDPLYTVGGGVCTGFASLMALYSRFFVKKARLQFAPTQLSNSGDVYFVLPVRSDEAAAGVVPTADMVMEGENSTFGLAMASYTRFSVINDIRSPAEFQGLSMNFGIPSNKEELSGAITTDPTTQPAWFVGLLGSAGHTLAGWALIEYTTELYRPNTLGDA